jgi:hypothetical protein
MMCVFDLRCYNENVSGLQDSLLRSDTWLHTYHEARDVENLYGYRTHPLGLFVAPRNNNSNINDSDLIQFSYAVVYVQTQ